MPGPNGLPLLGARVKRGEVLAYVEPAIGAVERLRQEVFSLKRDQVSVQETLNSRLSALESGLSHAGANTQNSAPEASH